MNSFQGNFIFLLHNANPKTITIVKLNSKVMDVNWNHLGKHDVLNNPRDKCKPKKKTTQSIDPILEAIYGLLDKLKKL